MVNIKKIKIVEEIKKNFKDSKAIFFYNYHWINSRKTFELKEKINKNDSLWKVYKNSLLKRVINFENFNIKIKGPTVSIFCFNKEKFHDNLKIISNFNKNNKTDKENIEKFKEGIFEGKIIDVNLIKKIANYPTKKESINEIIYYLKWQIFRFLNILNKIKK